MMPSFALRLAFACFFAACGTLAGRVVVAKPNVVVILSDDQGWGDLSLNGNKNLSTPNIDSLAKDGAQFDQFFVCPVCSPTRAEFLTGPQQGERFAVPVGTEAVVVGRSTSVGFDDPSVSRRHVEMIRGPSALTVEDLGSTNGTMVNGSAIVAAAPVGRGDRVQVGDVVMELV